MGIFLSDIYKTERIAGTKRAVGEDASRRRMDIAHTHVLKNNNFYLRFFIKIYYFS